MENRHDISIYMALSVLAISILACNAPLQPTPTPSPLLPTMTPHILPTLPPQETLPPTPTQWFPPTHTPVPPTPTEATPTPIPPSATNTPLQPTETPTPTLPVSTGPLDFTRPERLDRWQLLSDAEYECEIVLEITGGAPPYTVHHDLNAFTTWETSPVLTFTARECGAIVHTIKVESADGQTAIHDYWIPPPWCEEEED